jgi:hypothetical protein
MLSFNLCGQKRYIPLEIYRRMLAQYRENCYTKEDVPMAGKILEWQTVLNELMH